MKALPAVNKTSKKSIFGRDRIVYIHDRYSKKD